MPVTAYNCLVKSINFITPTVFELRFITDQPLEFKAGQFISIVIPGAGPKGRDLRRAYSIASPPERSPIELCITYVEGGPGSTYLRNLKEGDIFKGFAPYGTFVYQPHPEKNLMFISTGTGLAPFRAMLLSHDFQKNPPRQVISVFGVRHESELLYQEDFSGKERVQWIPCISRPSAEWRGFRGRVTDYLKTLPVDFPWTQTDYYLCGNGAMIDEVKTLLINRDVEKAAIFQEAYFKPPKH